MNTTKCAPRTKKMLKESYEVQHPKLGQSFFKKSLNFQHSMFQELNADILT